jgi:hypothetical protein
MRASPSIAAILCLALATPVWAKATKKKAAPPPPPPPVVVQAPPPEPPPFIDPAKNKKLTGIITADVGVGLLVGGVIMLGIAGGTDQDVPTRRGLYLGGGLCTGIGGTAAIIGTLIWLLARKETAEAREKQKKVSLLPTGFALRF